VEDRFSQEYSHTMAKVLLLTNSHAASADVLPALGLLQHTCKVAPLEASVLVDTPVMDIVFIDARRDFPAAKSFTRLLATTGVGAPIIAITTEGGLSAFTAEVDARIRIAVGAHAAYIKSTDPTSSEIRQGDVVIDEHSYTAKIKGTALDLTFKEFELLKYLAQHPGRVFTRAQLLQEIWGYDYFGGTRTVDVHIRRLRSKLGPEFESVIGTVRNVGYRFTVQSGGKETSTYELV
jgi:DNA-binding response OmpR family regulator